MQRAREQIESAGARIVLAHLTSDENAAALFQKYGLDDVPRVSDPNRELYAAFDLQRGKLSQVVGPAVWWKGFKTTILRGHLPGKPDGDIMQLPGTFLYHQGKILRAHRPTSTSDHPDFVEFTSGEFEA